MATLATATKAIPKPFSIKVGRFAWLPPQDGPLFLNFLKMADKAAAHFTMPMNHDWRKTHDVILRIHHYLKVNLYEHAGRQFGDAKL